MSLVFHNSKSRLGRKDLNDAHFEHQEGAVTLDVSDELKAKIVRRLQAGAESVVGDLNERSRDLSIYENPQTAHEQLDYQDLSRHTGDGRKEKEQKQTDEDFMVAEDRRSSGFHTVTSSNSNSGPQLPSMLLNNGRSRIKTATTVSADQSWRSLPLTDPSLKFAVLKRTAQLLGARIPDPAVASINTTADLSNVLSRKPKSTKLHQEIIEKGILGGLSNVHWGPKTQNETDREIGSLKVIKEEMQKMRLMTPKQRAWALGQ